MMSHEVDPKLTCPSCGHNLGLASNIDQSCEPPQEGDFSLCIRCGLPMKFGYNHFGTLTLFPLTRGDVDRLPVELAIQLSTAHRVLLERLASMQ